MKKLLIIFFGICVSVSSFGDVLMSPVDIYKIRLDYKKKAYKCPKDKPLYSTSKDKCYSCDTVESIPFNVKTHLADFCSKICPNRQLAKVDSKIYRYSVIEYCVLKDAPSEDWVLDKEIDWAGWIKKCPEDRPLYVGGECIACDEYNNWDKVYGVPGCEKCPNVVINSEDDWQAKCRFACPDDRPLLFDGGCVPCDYKGDDSYNIATGIRDGCEKCPNKEKDDRLNVCKEKGEIIY